MWKLERIWDYFIVVSVCVNDVLFIVVWLEIDIQSFNSVIERKRGTAIRNAV